MQACMHVCTSMYVPMNACMCACVSGNPHVLWLPVCGSRQSGSRRGAGWTKHVCMSVRVHACMYAFMYAYASVLMCMHVCMYVGRYV